MRLLLALIGSNVLLQIQIDGLSKEDSTFSLNYTDLTDLIAVNGGFVCTPVRSDLGKTPLGTSLEFSPNSQR